MRNWFYIVVIILLTAAVVVVWETPPELLLPGDREKPEHQAQLFSIITQAKARHFNEQGQLSYSFVAEQLRHYRYDVTRVSAEDYTIISQPRVTFYTETPPWHMRAAEGKLTDGGLTLTLSNDVHIWQAAATETDSTDPTADTSEHSTSELSTEYLTVRPREKTAHTDAAVTINTPTGTISATGMTADLRKHHITFLSDVKGSYDAM